jgi:hypothetical protein
MAKARVREVLTTAQDPLAVLVEMAADTANDPQLRVQAATAACPFIYPRLSAGVVANVAAPGASDPARLVDQVMQRIARMAPAQPAATTTIDHPTAMAAAE